MKILVNNNNKEYCQADPYIIKAEQKYYIFTTGVEGVKCYRSREFLGPYEYIGIVFKRDDYKEYWAPAVIEYEGKYYIYVSYMHKDSDDVHTQKIIVASSNNIEGPYEYQNDLCEAFSIDAHPVLNETGMYLFYSINKYEGDKIGTRIVVDKFITPTSLKREPKEVVVPSIEQEIFMKNRFKEGQDWYTIEGACYFKEGNNHYLLYSANCYQNAYYFVGYSVANSTENDLTKLEFKKYPNDFSYSPLLAKNNFESGTGHNSVIKVDNEWYIIYHGRNIEEENCDYDNRNMRIAKLIVKDGQLLVDRKKEGI